MKNDHGLAIIVSSCDSYSDAWEPFFTLLFRYWPDCPYPIYLLSESKIYQDKRVIPIIVSNPSWASRLKAALRLIPHPYVLYLQEDYFIERSIDTERIQKLFDIVKAEHPASLRIYPNPEPQLPYKNYSGVGEVIKGTPYRLSLQATIWDKSVFQDLLVDGDDPWNTEHEGSKRSNRIEPAFLSVNRNSVWSGAVSPVFEYVCTGISKRVWTWDAVYLFEKEGIEADFTKRDTERFSVYIRRRLRQLPYIGSLFHLLYRIEYKTKSLFRRPKAF